MQKTLKFTYFAFVTQFTISNLDGTKQFFAKLKVFAMFWRTYLRKLCNFQPLKLRIYPNHFCSVEEHSPIMGFENSTFQYFWFISHHKLLDYILFHDFAMINSYILYKCTQWLELPHEDKSPVTRLDY